MKSAVKVSGELFKRLSPFKSASTSNL